MMESDSGEHGTPDVCSARETGAAPSPRRATDPGQPMSSSAACKAYGTISADRRGSMTGLEFVRGLVDGSLPLNTIAETLGYCVTEAASGRVVIAATPTVAHLNPSGGVHGGLAAALALLVPLASAPLVTNLIALAFQALPVNLLLSHRSSEWVLPWRCRTGAGSSTRLHRIAKLTRSPRPGQWSCRTR